MKDLNEASTAIEEIFNGKFGKAENLLIEEYLDGEEMSFFQYMMEKILNVLVQHKIIKEF